MFRRISDAFLPLQRAVGAARAVYHGQAAAIVPPAASLNGQKCFSSSNESPTPNPIYELRVYRTQMVDFKPVVAAFEQFIHLRTNHSELMGFWTAEIGESIHELVHIWKYDSLSHRLKVRQALAADKEWHASFIPKLIPHVQYMTNALMAPVPGTAVNEDVEKDASAVYTLQRVLQNSPAPGSLGSGEVLIGRFLGVLGANNTEYRLWRYGNIDAALDASWKKTVDNDGSIANTLLYPTSFSPLQ
ncbi:protein NipSnap homolog 3B [Aplysia californica]|uniref:Protein NipSnap homolog 3B n=1 Tax=Aplysia californica TaxID=6500 RepID=A0ABM0K5Q5_APLCA|nr:protein NipSnap homolog 3B [Aplysia californica]